MPFFHRPSGEPRTETSGAQSAGVSFFFRAAGFFVPAVPAPEDAFFAPPEEADFLVAAFLTAGLFTGAAGGSSAGAAGTSGTGSSASAGAGWLLRHRRLVGNGDLRRCRRPGGGVELCLRARNPGDLVVHALVLPGGLVPAKVPGHAVMLEAPPSALIVVIEVHRLPQHPHHVVGVDVGKGKAVVPKYPVGDHRILESSGLPDHRYGAVPHGDHLGEAAGLGDGGHEEQIRAAVNGGAESGGILDAGREAAGILGLRMAERLLKIPFAGTQHHHLHIHIHDLWDGGGPPVRSPCAGPGGRRRR